MRTIKEAMGVANEETPKLKDDEKLENLRVAKKKFKNWVLGIILSFVPLLALPFSKFISNGDIGMMLYSLFCDISVMFIGISFTITALNDFMVKYAEKDDDIWVGLNLVLLLLGAIIYTTVVIEKDKNPDMEMNVVFWVNLIYFLLMLGLSANKYIKEIEEVR